MVVRCGEVRRLVLRVNTNPSASAPAYVITVPVWYFRVLSALILAGRFREKVEVVKASHVALGRRHTAKVSSLGSFTESYPFVSHSDFVGPG
jgi:hypothetical protein